MNIYVYIYLVFFFFETGSCYVAGWPQSFDLPFSVFQVSQVLGL
jgi:hypothetical protein